MHRKVYAKIAKALFKKLRLPKEYEEDFIEGMTIPDEWRLKNPKRKHHYISSSVFSYIMQARVYYVKGDIPSCLYNWYRIAFCSGCPYTLSKNEIPTQNTCCFREENGLLSRTWRRSNTTSFQTQQRTCRCKGKQSVA
nr:hypothetical protein [Candidatus Baldrarchaeota archaeon]